MGKTQYSVTQLGEGGRELWDGISESYDLDEGQKAQLLEACRAKDRCDQLDELLRGHISAWSEIQVQGDEVILIIDRAMEKAMASANIMKQLLAALRLPDEAGKRPTFRSARGAQAPKVPGGAPTRLTALDKARAARGA